MLLQSIRIEGKQLQDGYAIRLDNTLPKRDSRDRDPGVTGCKRVLLEGDRLLFQSQQMPGFTHWKNSLRNSFRLSA
jgi:hypothetical protein